MLDKFGIYISGVQIIATNFDLYKNGTLVSISFHGYCVFGDKKGNIESSMKISYYIFFLINYKS